MAQPDQPGQDWAVYQGLEDAARAYLRDADIALDAITAVVDLDRRAGLHLRAGAEHGAPSASRCGRRSR